MKRYKLRITGRQYAALFKHLYPGDGKEAISLALCGVGKLQDNASINYVVAVNELYPIPYDQYKEREADRVTWSSEIVADILMKAEKKGLVVLKIHSHPSGLSNFSSIDDQADINLFPRIAEWLDTDFPGISAVMLPDGKIFARAFNAIGESTPIDSVLIAGPDIKFWKHSSPNSDSFQDDFRTRTAQAFGKGTTQLLSQLSIGVVGISGTGSPVVEQLFRLGVGKLVLVDDDIVKELNIGRIINSTLQHAQDKRKKVDVISEAIKETGLPTSVEGCPTSLMNSGTLRKLAQCDILFGCMDSIEGRDLLNKLSAFYSIPYFDIGVQLNADGHGGINQICGTIHYLQPEGPSLISRGVYNPQNLYEEVMKRTNPDQYQQLEDEGYIKGINEDRPAVISVNTLMASFAVNDLLSRLHDIRLDSNEDIDCIRISLTNCSVSHEKVSDEKHPLLLKYLGRGDMDPILDSTIYE